MRLKDCSFRLVIGGLLLATTLTGCHRGQETTEPLKIAYLPITHALPLFASAELPDSVRLNKDVELVKFGAWTELAEALNTGRIDGAIILSEMAVKAQELGVPIKTVALGHHDGNVAVVDPDIETGADLKGKTVAIPHRLSSHNILLNLILERSGLKPSDVNVTELPPPEMPAALSEGRIAGYIVAEPFGAKGVESGAGKVLYESADLWPHSVCCSLVLRSDAIKKRPEQVEKFLADYHYGADSLGANPAWAMQVARKYLKADSTVIARSLGWISFDNLQPVRKDYEVLSGYMKQYGLSKDVPTFDVFADTTIYQTSYDKFRKK
jgi:NitT/TauT family transport system substrate-binding protein